MNKTELKQGSLNGLLRQIRECLDSAYNKGYEDGKKEPIKVTNVEDTNEYQIGYKQGVSDSKVKIEQAYKDGYDKGHLEGLVKGNKIGILACKVTNPFTEKEVNDIANKERQDGYNRGLEDLSHAMKVYFPLNSEERLKHFGTNIQTERYAIENPKDLIAMAKAYEEKKEAEIKVGDEVVIDDKGRKAVVSRVLDNGLYNIVFYNGDTNCVDRPFIAKTGKHYDIESILKELGE